MTKELNSQKQNQYQLEKLSNTKLMGLVYNCELGSRLKLSGATLNVLYALCYHWNTIRKDCFPSQQLISTKTGLSISSVKRGIKELLEKGLILKVQSKRFNSNKYFFTAKFFNLINLTPAVVHYDTHRVHNEPRMEHENITKRKNKITSLDNKKTKDDDVEYKKILTQLQDWNVTRAPALIRKHGQKKVKHTILIVKNRQPKNCGAYFRSLLSLPGNLNLEQSKNDEKTQEPLINQMLKQQYWRHIPTGQIMKVKPDIGTHLLIQYYHKEKMVTFFENGLTDNLENFEALNKAKDTIRIV